MKEKKYTDAELIAAHKLAWPEYGFNDEARLAAARYYAELTDLWRPGFPVDRRIFALALGILPDGWERVESGDSFEYLLRVGGRLAIRAYRGPSADWPSIECPADYWLEAVSTGRYVEAGTIMAAHVELERRREQGGK